MWLSLGGGVFTVCICVWIGGVDWSQGKTRSGSQWAGMALPHTSLPDASADQVQPTQPTTKTITKHQHSFAKELIVKAKKCIIEKKT